MESAQKRRKPSAIYIPVDIVSIILDHVDVNDHAAFTLVCKEWRNLFLESPLSLKHRIVTQINTAILNQPKNIRTRLQFAAIHKFTGKLMEDYIIPIPEDKSMVLLGSDWYKGELKDGKRHGKGIYWWGVGGRHEGEFENGKKHGKGILYWPDGERYEGWFKNGKGDGNGILYHSDGGRFVGQYKNGKRNGKGTKYLPDGTSVNQFFVNGVLQNNKQ